MFVEDNSEFLISSNAVLELLKFLGLELSIYFCVVRST